MIEHWQENALNQGLHIGQEAALPIQARSVTKAEAMGRDRNIALLLLAIGGVIVAGLVSALAIALMIGRPAPVAWQLYVFSAMVCAFGGLIMWNKRSDYVDPQIEVEVGEGGITVRSPSGEEHIPFAEAAFDVRTYSVDNSAQFIGIMLASQAGTVDMHDLLYRDGRKAAAAILYRADLAGRRPGYFH